MYFPYKEGEFLQRILNSLLFKLNISFQLQKWLLLLNLIFFFYSVELDNSKVNSSSAGRTQYEFFHMKEYEHQN